MDSYGQYSKGTISNMPNNTGGMQMPPGQGVNGHGTPQPPSFGAPPQPLTNDQGQFRPGGQFPMPSRPMMNGPSNTSGAAPPRPLGSQPPSSGVGGIPLTNPSGPTPPPRFPGFVVPPSSQASMNTRTGSPATGGTSGRPSELPAPFHGQGQYSHQVNPFLQKTPVQTPVNSEPPSQKSSRGPSPVSGSTIDALEGQFTPAQGTSPKPPAAQSAGPRAPPPQFPGGPPQPGAPPSQFTPQGMSGPRPPTGFQPPRANSARFPPPSSVQGSISSGAQSTLPPGPPGMGGQQTFGGPAPPVSSGVTPPPMSSAARFASPMSSAGSAPPNMPPRFPTSSGSSGMPPPVSSSSARFPSPMGNTSPGFPPSSNAARFPPPPTTGTAPPTSNAAPRYPMPSTTGRYPLPPTSNAGFTPPPTSSAGYPPPPISSAGYPPPPTSSAGYPPPPTSSAGYPLPPTSNATPGFPPSNARYPPPTSSAGFPPPTSNVPQGFPPAPTVGQFPPSAGGPGFAPPSSTGLPSQPGMPPTSQYMGHPTGTPGIGGPGSYPTPLNQPGAYPNNMNAMTQNFGQMGIQDSQRVVNLLNEKNLVPSDGVETAKPVLPHDFKRVNCSPDVFRCTLNAIPQTSALLNKARLPLGILIHPFRDLSQLPVIQSSVIVRCRSCRTYINPFVVFADQRRWKCNLCFRVNDLPEEFSFDPVSKTYGDPQRRPEVKSATIEFIAPSEYMLRPPQPAVYLFLLDVSFNAVGTGYLSQFCQILLDELDKLPGDARTSVGFMCYDRSLYYFNLAEGLSQPQMYCVPDLDDPFLPCPDNLLVNLHESKELIIDLLNQLPSLFEGNLETGSALGAALQSAHKMMGPTGGRITVMQTCLPTVGPGALQNRDVGSNNGKNVTNIGPATDFYKKLSLDCSAQQIAVDLFMLNGQYADIATLSCISKYSAGCVYSYPSFHTERTPSLVDKFDTDLRRYLTRKIGFESVMRIRCTRGLSIHTFHGNFFVRSTDLLSLPNINPDAGFGMQMSIEDSLTDSTTVSFQAALLYTSSKGERRIRVHTLCVPVTNQISEVFASVDQQAVVALLAKMAVDRSQNSAISDARDAMINAPMDTLQAYAQQVPASQRVGALLAPFNLRLLPMYMLAMLKSVAFSIAGNTKTDDRVFAMQQCKTLPLCYLIQNLYPDLYPLHKVSDEKTIKRGKEEIPTAPKLQLSSANIDRTGMFLMDTGDAMYVLVGSGVGDQMCQDVLDKPNFMSIPDGMIDLPELENPTSERIRSFVNYLMDSRPNGVTFMVIRDDSKHRHLFFQHMLEDRSENSMSYYEFLQFLQGKAKG